MDLDLDQALAFALQCEARIAHYQRQADAFARLRRVSRFSFAFYGWKRAWAARRAARRSTVTFWLNRRLRVAFKALAARAHAYRVLLRACAYLAWRAWRAWRDFVDYHRQREVALLMVRSTPRHRLQAALRAWRRGARLTRRERDITRVAIAKHRKRGRDTRAYFGRWVWGVIRRRVARGALRGLLTVWGREACRAPFDRWRTFARRLAVLRRKQLRVAAALRNQSSSMRCLRAWSAWARRTRQDRKRTLGRWRNRSVGRVFRAWAAFWEEARRRRTRARRLVRRVAAAWRQRATWSAFGQWARQVARMRDAERGVLAPELETLLAQAHEVAEADDANTRRLRDSWGAWRNPLRGAEQTMDFERSRYGNRWVARHVPVDARSRGGPGGGLAGDGDGDGWQGARTGRQPTGSDWRPPLAGAHGPPPPQPAAPGFEFDPAALDQSILDTYRARYRQEMTAALAKSVAAEGVLEATRRGQAEADADAVATAAEMAAAAAEDETLSRRDDAYAYAFDYFQFLGAGRKAAVGGASTAAGSDDDNSNSAAKKKKSMMSP